MAERIIVEANDVWDYFLWQKHELQGSMKEIAKNDEYGVEIYLTSDKDLPLIVVTADDEEVYEEHIISRHDCATTVKDIYDEYLTSNAIKALTGDDNEYTAAEEMEMIDDRESELTDAVYVLLLEFAANIFEVAEDADELCEGIKDLICEYLYRKHGISVYRPMYLEDEDGTDEFVEFPYPEIEF